jgi:excisionase family DNA binding protein
VTTRQAEKAYTLQEAAELKSVSVDTLRRAIRSKGGKDAPFPLRAKKIGGKFRIPATALEEWFDGLEDA